MTSESETLSPLIGNIYDAALGQIGWSGVLQKICGFVGAVGADISSQNSTATDVIGYREFNIAREQTQPYFDKYTQLYFDKYVALNPINPVLPLLEVEKVYSLSDLLPYNEFYGTRFYKEWLGPQGVVDFFLASLEKSGTRTAFLTLRRNADNGLVNDDARRRMALVIPHVRRAMVIGKVIDFRKAEAAALTDTFAGLAAGIFLVDAKGRIVFCNDAGQSVLNEGKLIQIGRAHV